jgi:hypothetical protein
MPWLKFSNDESWHVSWAVSTSTGTTYLHAIGNGGQGNRITQDMARMRFEKGRVRSPWVPILFASRALIEGRRSINCVTAAAGAICRGWFWLP